MAIKGWHERCSPGTGTATDNAMRHFLYQFGFGATIAALSAALTGTAADAAGFSDLTTYSQPIGLAPGQETQPIDPSLRDANGNLTVVNGQFTSSSISRQSGVQQASTAVSGSGGTGSGAMFGGATAIGNSLNVITTGSNNTVVVTSTQTNNGNQQANVSINGH